MPKYDPKYDPQKLNILIKLREDAGLTQKDVAKFFRLKDRRSIAAWETGVSCPSLKRHFLDYRSRFIDYLRGELNLRSEPKEFLKIWEDVMVGEWRWKPLSEDELRKCFPGQLKEKIIHPESSTIELVFYGEKPQTIPFLAPTHPGYDLVGRDHLIRELKQQLFAGGSHALSALNGLPGIGKTALAVALAHDHEVQEHFRDGILWARLGQKENVPSELSRWARALGIPSDETRNLTQQKVSEAIHDAIGLRRMLLIIDDAWELKSALAFEVDCPNCAYLVTTRIPEIALRFSDGNVMTVPELSDEDGLDLLRKLAPEVVEAEPDKSRKLVQSVAGLPLALVLMGNYLRVEGHSQQPRRLLSAFDRLLEPTERLNLPEDVGPLEEHPSLPAGTPRSLTTIIGISDAALDDETRRVFYSLAVFPPKPNTFSEDAALAVAATKPKILDKLWNYGLLESSGPGRYTLHQTIVDYGMTKFTDTMVYQRMVDFFVGYVEANKAKYEALEPELNNIFAAFQIADDRRIYVQLIQAMGAFLPIVMLRGLDALVETLSIPAEQARSLRDSFGLLKILSAMSKVGLSWQYDGMIDESDIEYLEEDLSAVSEKVDWWETLRESVSRIADIALGRGEYLGSLVDVQLLIRKFPETVRAAIVTLMMWFEAEGKRNDDLELIDEYYREALALVREDGDRKNLYYLLRCIAVFVSLRGDYAKAENYWKEALAMAWEIGDSALSEIIDVLIGLSTVSREKGDLSQSQEYALEGLKITRQLGDRGTTGNLLNDLGLTAIARGNFVDAENYLSEALALAREIDDKEDISNALISLGLLRWNQQQLDLAVANFSEARELAERINNSHLIANACYCLAQVSAAKHNFAEALRQGLESVTMFEAIGKKQSADEIKQWLEGLPAVDASG